MTPPPSHASLQARATTLIASLEGSTETVIAAWRESENFARELEVAAGFVAQAVAPPAAGATARLALAARLLPQARFADLWTKATASLHELRLPSGFLHRCGDMPLNQEIVEEFERELAAAQSSVEEWTQRRTQMDAQIAAAEARVLTRAAMLLVSAMGTFSLDTNNPDHISGLQKDLADVPALLAIIGTTAESPRWRETAGKLADLFQLFLHGPSAAPPLSDPV